jgi:hypothetical protein
MTSLTTTVAFSQDLRGGTEPAGPTITLRVDNAGFHDAGGIGGSGQVVEPVAIERVAELLRSEFEPAELDAILGHFVALRDALRSAP